MSENQSELERIDKMLAEGVISLAEANKLRGAICNVFSPEITNRRYGGALLIAFGTPLSVFFFYFMFGFSALHYDYLLYPISMLTALHVSVNSTFFFALAIWIAGILLWLRHNKHPEKYKGIKMIKIFTFVNPILIGLLFWFYTNAALPLEEKKNAFSQQESNSRVKASDRMMRDRKRYSVGQLQEIESLYQVANKKWNTKEGKESLERLVAKYKNANRTGCALLYLGQMSKGKEREKYLREAIDKYSDCFYGDGVQVGAYARYYLAWYYAENNEPEKANALFNEIKKDYPDAIAHNGTRLVIPTEILPKSEFHTAKSCQTHNPKDHFIYDGKFTNNPAAIGNWVSVDFVNSINEFKPDKKQWPGALYLKDLTMLPEGKTGKEWRIWTGDYLLHTGGDKSASKFTIKQIGGKNYMFLEWISGDVLLRGEAPKYYVLTQPK